MAPSLISCLQSEAPGSGPSRTSINPVSQFGILKLGENGEVTGVDEKPKLDHWINAGFFVFSKKIFDYFRDGWELEKEVFQELAKKNEIIAFRHRGFWACMNTFKDTMDLNKMWKSGKTPWKVW